MSAKKILDHWGPPSKLFTFDVRQDDSLLLWSARRILLCWRPPKGFFIIEVPTKTNEHRRSCKKHFHKAPGGPSNDDKRTQTSTNEASWTFPPGTWRAVKRSQTKTNAYKRRQLNISTGLPTAPPVRFVRHEDSLSLRSAKRILYYCGPPHGFFSIELRQEDSLLLTSAKRILH
jgi:hypothetical protein